MQVFELLLDVAALDFRGINLLLSGLFASVLWYYFQIDSVSILPLQRQCLDI